MKLTIISLGLFVALCYVIDSTSANSHHHHHHHHGRSHRHRSYKFLQLNCPNGGRATEEEYGPNEGVLAFTGVSDGNPCTFLLTGPSGYQTELDITFRTQQSAGAESCSDGGQMTVYAGADSSAPVVLQVCDKQNKQTFHVNGNQAFINFVKDQHQSVFKVLFRFVKNGRRTESLDLFEAWKSVSRRNRKSKSYRHHSTDDTHDHHDWE